ncbi:hypothetical protein ACWN8P_12775 [Vagococcus salmoninarum]|uniref:Uncharacterized protein n=1 Tax=Vagococcus salmoninarum TaxID=2739 RepID=A0A429ZE29_9ENTE|nr:hypothetical protein [Vagococcus salmoninarum]RST91966.1 hypothetical protein CBF35_13540 [Vagococcus salmoninarum]
MKFLAEVTSLMEKLTYYEQCRKLKICQNSSLFSRSLNYLLTLRIEQLKKAIAKRTNQLME